MALVNESVALGKIAKIATGYVLGNVSGVLASPQSVSLNDVAAALVSDPNAVDVLGVKFVRPRVPYRKTVSAIEKVVAVATQFKGVAATLHLYGSVDGGAFSEVASGPNNADLEYTITTTHAYVFYSQVTYNTAASPISETLSVAVGGTGVVGGGRDDLGGIG
jgi:hypothetical protein